MISIKDQKRRLDHHCLGLGCFFDQIQLEQWGSELGPAIYAIPLCGGTTAPRQLLSFEERRKLSHIALTRRFDAGAFLFRETEQATEIFNIVSGVVKTTTTLADGRQSTAAFFFNHDLLGMFEAGYYSQTAEALTSVTSYSFPIDALESLLRKDPDLQFHFFSKVLDELRVAQRQALVLGRFGATQRIALFLDLLDRHPEMHQSGGPSISIPMDRSDIADYVGLTVESVSRTLQRLHRACIIYLDGRHAFEIRDRVAFDRLIGGTVTADDQMLFPAL